MRRRGDWSTCVFLALTAAGGVATAPSASAQADTAWSAVFRMDVDTARAILAASHPGAVDRRNPAFARTLVSAYAEALRAAPRIDSYRAYAIALARFGNRFQDGHLNVGGLRTVDGVREPGIFPVRTGRTFTVEEADARYGALTGELRGATVVACDGVPAGRLFRDRVLSWRGRAGVEADWVTWAPLLLVDYGPPTPPAPRRCTFRRQGRSFSVPLQWTETTGREIALHRQRLIAFPPRPLSLERYDGGRTLWVNLPTFAVQGDSGSAAMRGLIDTVRAEMGRNRSWKLLVFDLRGNSGGSSLWGDDLTAAVFGEAWRTAADAWLDDGVYTEWRVSPQNIGSYAQVVEEVEQQHGKDSPAAADARAHLDSLRAALARGASTYGHPQRRTGVPRPPAVAVPGTIVVVTSASCFSACLDFLDRVRQHPRVVQVGETTGVDTNYMENWGRNLPSGLAAIGHPMKVYRNRRRGNNEAYVPHLRYPGRLQDTGGLRSWLAARFADQRRE